ncbi:MAG: CoA pyrophosphatase [Fimbriimonadaceae bacterium]|nr:CoA pyrophosphatase [Alphaproteobacteria bacterium]
MIDFSADTFANIARDRLNFDIVPAAHDVANEAPRGDHLINPGLEPPAELMNKYGLTRAAVLIPVVNRPEGATVLLTQRTDHLDSHPGQVAFPGGKIEKGDRSPLDTALRETHEEVGLSRNHVEAIGYLPPYQTTSGFRIVPVVSIVQPPFHITPDHNEVADVFEVPLSFLMNPDNHDKQSRVWENRRRYFFVMPYLDYYIWGVTAGIIRELYEEIYRK